MSDSKFALAGAALLAALVGASCEADEGNTMGAAGSTGDPNGGKAGAATNGGGGAKAGESAGAGKGAGLGGSGNNGSGGASEGGSTGEAGETSGGAGPVVPEECGDPKKDGVLVYQDIVTETNWTCPVYTLTQPIYVRSTDAGVTVLHIAPGVTVRGIKGVEPIKLPGALIITRSGRIDAVGTAQHPIVFTSSEPVASVGPGSWGGLMLLGRSALNVPDNFETSGKTAGEAYAEALPKSELGLYGWPASETGTGGAGGEGGGPSEPIEDYSAWDCGKLQYVRIDFAGFKAGASKELNGLTLGACGSDTLVDHVQVHRSSDDGIEIFGGTVNLTHIVLTGNQDDSLDWDQGWRGKAQFVAIQSHDDADGLDSCGIEADGFATPDAPVGLPSAPRIFNLTLIASKNTQRGIRFRDGTQAFLANAILAAHASGVPLGLIDVDHVRTADALAEGKLVVQYSILRGPWPANGQADSQNVVRNEQDFFTGAGDGALGNDVIDAASELWLNAFNTAAPEWVPAAASAANEGGVTPSDVDGSSFFDSSATYRGAFEPGGDDWTAAWTSYP